MEDQQIHNQSIQSRVLENSGLEFFPSSLVGKSLVIWIHTCLQSGVCRWRDIIFHGRGRIILSKCAPMYYKSIETFKWHLGQMFFTVLMQIWISYLPTTHISQVECWDLSQWYSLIYTKALTCTCTQINFLHKTLQSNLTRSDEATLSSWIIAGFTLNKQMQLPLRLYFIIGCQGTSKLLLSRNVKYFFSSQSGRTLSSGIFMCIYSWMYRVGGKLRAILHL